MADILTQDILFFFDKKPGALALYEALARAVLSRWPETELRVQKTQIGFCDPGLFVCASLTPVRPRAQRPEPYLTVSFGLDRPLEDPRALAVPVRPNRWTHHVILGSPGELDETLLAWIADSHQLTSERKHRNA